MLGLDPVFDGTWTLAEVKIPLYPAKKALS